MSEASRLVIGQELDIVAPNDVTHGSSVCEQVLFLRSGLDSQLRECDYTCL